MGATNRLNATIARLFPTTTATKVAIHIATYRKVRDGPKVTDWEGNGAFFRKVINIAIRDRHKRK